MGIILNVNITAGLEFGLIYLEATVQPLHYDRSSKQVLDFDENF